MNLLDRFQRYVASHELLKPDDRILLTVSGGVDSMAMLSLFTRSGYKVGVAHCNFCLRGTEGDEDEALVLREAARLGCPAYNRRFDTRGEMERTGESMEMAARRLRYAWFEELCREHGYTVVAVAHHMDDSVETFFINLLRGTGLRGLLGIHKQVGRVVRPLMFATRHDILEYAAHEHIPFREDSTNQSTQYVRNKIRLGLIPRIKEIAPRFTERMEQNIGRLTDAQRFIDSAIDRIREIVVSPDPNDKNTNILDVDKIAKKFPLNFVIFEILNSSYAFRGDVVDALFRAWKQRATGKRFYSKSHVATIDRGRILISPITSEDPCETTIEATQSRAYAGNSVLYLEQLDVDLLPSRETPSNVALLDADKLQFPLTVRRWAAGDSFIPFGMTGRKKVSDFLIDEKVSLPEKSRQFVLLSNNEIVWLVGRRIDARFALTNETENVLKITQEII